MLPFRLDAPERETCMSIGKAQCTGTDAVGAADATLELDGCFDFCGSLCNVIALCDSGTLRQEMF